MPLLARVRQRLPLLFFLFGVALLVAFSWLAIAERGAPEPSEGLPPALGPPPAAVLGPPARLSGGEEQTIEVFESAAPSVVYISSVATVSVRRHFFGTDMRKVPAGTGTGFVWDQRGHVVTNFHVIAQASEATVRLADGSEWEASLVGTAPDHDLAVLRIEAPEPRLRPLPIGSSSTLRVGQSALAIGNPFGLDHTLTTGVVSALDREIESVSGRTIYGVIQTDAAINPGNSGGPLLDSSGRLVGVNTAIKSPSGASAGIGFAVPVDTVRRVVPQLIEHGKAVRPGLGVLLTNDEVARRLGAPGVVVRGVVPGGAAEAAGLQPLFQDRRGRLRLGDVIVGVDGEACPTVEDLLKIMDARRVGDVVRVEVERAGARRTVNIALHALP